MSAVRSLVLTAKTKPLEVTLTPGAAVVRFDHMGGHSWRVTIQATPAFRIDAAQSMAFDVVWAEIRRRTSAVRSS